MVKRFVEIPEPLAADVEMDLDLNWEPYVMCTFSVVPLDKMHLIEAEFNHLIQNLTSGLTDIGNVSDIKDISESMM